MPLSALAKLIGNALRHAARGETAISRTFENSRSVHIEVENRGAAIAPEHLAHRFDRLLRIDPKHHRAGQGAGLSLAIDETIALAHGESFGVSSSVGRNRFWRRIASA
ncbi:MAG TPA: ATP-binding protein [Rubrivivax sp.]|nr:ATP-binding protein [Rubrivivax sp.]